MSPFIPCFQSLADILHYAQISVWRDAYVFEGYVETSWLVFFPHFWQLGCRYFVVLMLFTYHMFIFALGTLGGYGEASLGLKL